jgi:hypothetical protein
VDQCSWRKADLLGFDLEHVPVDRLFEKIEVEQRVFPHEVIPSLMPVRVFSADRHAIATLATPLFLGGSGNYGRNNLKFNEIKGKWLK